MEFDKRMMEIVFHHLPFIPSTEGRVIWKKKFVWVCLSGQRSEVKKNISYRKHQSKGFKVKRQFGRGVDWGQGLHPPFVLNKHTSRVNDPKKTSKRKHQSIVCLDCYQFFKVFLIHIIVWIIFSSSFIELSFVYIGILCLHLFQGVVLFFFQHLCIIRSIDTCVTYYAYLLVRELKLRLMVEVVVIRKVRLMVKMVVRMKVVGYEVKVRVRIVGIRATM